MQTRQQSNVNPSTIETDPGELYIDDTDMESDEIRAHFDEQRPASFQAGDVAVIDLGIEDDHCYWGAIDSTLVHITETLVIPDGWDHQKKARHYRREYECTPVWGSTEHVIHGVPATGLTEPVEYDGDPTAYNDNRDEATHPIAIDEHDDWFPELDACPACGCNRALRTYSEWVGTDVRCACCSMNLVE
jgi:hypothetical protein